MGRVDASAELVDAEPPGGGVLIQGFHDHLFDHHNIEGVAPLTWPFGNRSGGHGTKEGMGTRAGS